jgi:hypothetical protein
VLSTQVNGNSAVQRSRVTSLKVTFSAPVTFATTAAAAFTLTRNSGGTVAFNATATVNGLGQTEVVLDNFSGAATEFGSLADGRYTLTALANQISAGGVNMASNFTFGDPQGLFRMYGDVTGDRRVDIADFGQFSLAYLTPANYIPALDFNNDTRIDIADFGQFSVRYFTSLP